MRTYNGPGAGSDAHGAGDGVVGRRPAPNSLTVADLQHAEIAAALFLSRRHAIRLPIARIIARELGLSLAGGAP